MRIGIIGVNGRLGRKLYDEAVSRGHQVIGFAKEGDESRKGIHAKSLFDLTREDVKELDALLSAFGSGFDADPSINKLALEKMGELVQYTRIHLIAIGGAGLLYTDKTHFQHVYQTEGHPAFLRPISENLLLGLESLQKQDGVRFTVVCPSLTFDYEGEKKGRYQVGTKQEVLYSHQGESRISYADLAMAMVDFAEENSYVYQCVTVCEE